MTNNKVGSFFRIKSDAGNNGERTRGVLQRRRWVWKRSASQCDRRCCPRKHRTGGTLPSPAQTAGPGRRRARSPPSCGKSRRLCVKDSCFLLASVCLFFSYNTVFPVCVSAHSRSALHSERAHSLETKLHHIAALRGELVAPALEALFIEDNDLPGKWRRMSWCWHIKHFRLFACLWEIPSKSGFLDSPSSGRKTWYNGASSFLGSWKWKQHTW